MVAPVQVGDILADKYQVTKILGAGGMGVVVAARNCELDKLVALKFMHAEMSSNEQVATRFLREARAAARLQNEHVVHVLDVARLPNGVPYIVMEHLEGRDLGQLLEQCGPLEIAEAVEYVLQVCEAMAEAHVQGIVHRDLKPENLFLTIRQDGRHLVKVLDFGISKAQCLPGPSFTLQIIGSPSYMGPEQIRSSRSVDARADIWSLGVILYQLISNTLPFAGDTAPEVMAKVLWGPTPSLASARSGVPTGLVNVVNRCLEKECEDRFSNVAELAQALLPYTPERARAAISLIEHVMIVGIQQPTSAAPDGKLAAIQPRIAAPIQVPGQEQPDPTQTTLDTANWSILIGGQTNPSRWRWSRLMAIGIAAVATLAILIVFRWSPTAPVAAPANAAIVPVDGPSVIDAGSFNAPLDARLEASPDAPTQPESRPTNDAKPPVSAPKSAATRPVVVKPTRKTSAEAGATESRPLETKTEEVNPAMPKPAVELDEFGLPMKR